MTNNLAIIVKFENPSDIYPEINSVCLKELKNFEKKYELKKPYNIIKIKSSIPEKWCEFCNTEYN